MTVRKLEVLIVAENEVWCRSISQKLHDQGHHYNCVTTLLDARHSLLSQTTPPDALVMEFVGSFDEVSVFIKELRAAERTRSLPVILLLSEAADIPMTTLNMGPTDFIILPADPDQLLYRIVTNIRNRDTFRQLEQQNRLLERLAAYDDLTGLYNRRSFMEALEMHLGKLPDAEGGVVVYLVDLDGFKDINDNCGHLVGDRVLQTFSEMVSQCLRPGDLLGRYGGDEFCLLQVDIGYEQAMAVADRLCNCIRLHEFPLTQFNLPPMSLTASIGGAFVSHGSRVSSHQAIACADEALYEVKGNGRNGFAIREVRSGICR